MPPRPAWPAWATRTTKVISGTVASVPAAAAPPRAQPAAATQLADRQSPAAAPEVQTKPRGPGEAYRPAVVNLVLDHPAVVARDARGPVVKQAPTTRTMSDAPQIFINLIGSLIYAITVPHAAILLTLYCFDRRARPASRYVRS